MSTLTEMLEGDLQGLAESAPQSLTLGQVHQRVDRRRRRRVYVRTLGSLVCVGVLVAGLLAIGQRTPRSNSTHPGPAPGDTVVGDSDGVSPTDVAASVTLPDRGADFVAATDPPLLSMPADGWTVSYIDDTTMGRVRLAVVDAVKGFAGGSFVVRPASYEEQLGTGTTIPTNGVDGIMTGTSDAFRWFEWHVGDALLSAHARHVTEANALAITSAIALNPDGSLIIGSVPAGMVTLTDPEVGNMTRYVEYHWTSPDQSRTLGLTMQPGGDIGVEIPADGTLDATPITFDDKPAYLINGGMGVAQLDGFWVWTIGGTGYTDSAEFLADARQITTTDQATWESELAGHAVLPSQRPEHVADILSDIPLPPGFDTDPLTGSTQAKVRYQLVAEVTSAVWCAWAHDWDTALTAGDAAAATTAAQAIASSTTWHALEEINDEGGWSEVMWESSARVARGDRTVVAESNGGLGCYG